MWTTWVRERAVGALPPEKLLPDRQPSYVSSWIYVFGVATIAALIVVVASGMILGLKGPEWWHVSSVGHFFNSIHLWAVELFFFAMVVHLWGKFFMGAWRGGRGRTWVTGAVTFLVAIGAAFTGYLSQQNFDSQWIATPGQGRDQLDRRRRLLQRHRLRPDVHLPRDHAAGRSWSCWSSRTCCSCAATEWFRPTRRRRKRSRRAARRKRRRARAGAQ